MRTKEELEKRRQYLQQVEKEKEKALIKAPSGTLRVMKQGEKIRYYWRSATNHETLHQGKQSLVTPLRPSDEEYVRNWEAVEYEGKPFGENVPEFYSMKGERVRSKSEVIIADMLYQMGIPYRYEYPLYLQGLGKIYPDFTVLNVRERKEIFWEHFGRMDDADYAERAVKKINCFRQNGYYEEDRTLFTYETRKEPLNQKMIRYLIEHRLQ